MKVFKMDELEKILENASISKKVLDLYGFNKVMSLHNNQEVFSNNKYTVVVRESFSADDSYNNLYHWLNEEN